MRRAKTFISKFRAAGPAGRAVPKLHFELDYLDDHPPTPPGVFSNHAAFKILRKMLQPESDLAIEDAGEKIVDMCVPTETRSYPAAGSTDAVGTMICAMAQQIPYNDPSHIKMRYLSFLLFSPRELKTLTRHIRSHTGSTWIFQKSTGA